MIFKSVFVSDKGSVSGQSSVRGYIANTTKDIQVALCHLAEKHIPANTEIVVFSGTPIGDPDEDGQYAIGNPQPVFMTPYLNDKVSTCALTLAGRICPDKQQSAITDAVKLVLAKHLSCGGSVYEINNGGCYDFAHEVMDEICDVHHLTMMEFDDVCKFDDSGNRIEINPDFVSLLRIPPSFVGFYNKTILDSEHAWIAFAGKFYDASVPDGVGGIIDLPFFRMNTVNKWIGHPSFDKLVDHNEYFKDSVRMYKDFVEHQNRKYKIDSSVELKEKFNLYGI